MFPEPTELKPEAFPDPVVVHVSELMSGLRARGSVTEPPEALDGPVFVTATV
jgi:hypothetical protein